MVEADSMRRRFTREQFTRLVDQAMDDIPERFKPMLDNIMLVVEDDPSPQTRRELDLRTDIIYGLYTGTPLIERDAMAGYYPDKIEIYQRPLEQDFGDDPAELVRQIRITVLHEIGHHFGLDDEDMAELED
jgi:predicted Zn-dependent protease with MMP-like domain